MADLDNRLHTIIDSCAPKRDNNCLHSQLNGLTTLDMAAVMANYVQYATQHAEKHLPVLNMDDMLKGLDPKLQPRGPGDVTAYNFHERY